MKNYSIKLNTFISPYHRHKKKINPFFILVYSYKRKHILKNNHQKKKKKTLTPEMTIYNLDQLNCLSLEKSPTAKVLGHNV